MKHKRKRNVKSSTDDHLIQHCLFTSLSLTNISKENPRSPLLLEKGTKVPLERLPCFANGKSAVSPPPDPPPLRTFPPNEPLKLSLGPFIGHGHGGKVFNVKVEGPTTVKLPRLIAKIARRRLDLELAREAGFYEEFRGLQGIVIPRSYGFFQLELKSDPSDIKAWQCRKFEEPELEDSLDPDELVYVETRDLYDRVTQPDGSYQYIFRGGPESSRIPLRSRLSKPIILSVLILEKLVPTPFPGKRTYERDINHLFDDLAKYGIKHEDVRRHNILRARTPVICPNHKYAHEWQFVDFAYVSVYDKGRKQLAVYESSKYARDELFYPGHCGNKSGKLLWNAQINIPSSW